MECKILISPAKLKAPGNMMRSPAFSIIHKADNPQGLTTLVDAFHRRYKS